MDSNTKHQDEDQSQIEAIQDVLGATETISRSRPRTARERFLRIMVESSAGRVRTNSIHTAQPSVRTYSE
jgi:hypothetical protein